MKEIGSEKKRYKKITRRIRKFLVGLKNKLTDVIRPSSVGFKRLARKQNQLSKKSYKKNDKKGR